jgi:aminopeptidase N
MEMKTRFFSFLLLLLIGIKFSSAQDTAIICSKQKLSNSTMFKASFSNNRFVDLLASYDVNYHFLDLSLEADTTFILGSVLTQFTVLNPLDTFTFELHQDFQIDSIVDAQSKNYTYNRINDEVYVPLSAALQTNQNFCFKIYYHGTPPSGASAAIGNGFSNDFSPNYGTRVTWSLSQPYVAKEWWPCKQSLLDKIDSVTIHVTTSNTNKVGSNGLLKNIVALAKNKHRFEWESKYPIDYYLISVSVGNYFENIDYAKPKGIQDSILILNYLYNEQAYNDNKKTLGECKDVLSYYSECFGTYPFYKEKYGHSMAPFSGGMEHQTMTTLGIISYDVMVHELAHQWFGDEVTCSSWSDLWLNEGFATYAELLAYEKFYPQYLANKLFSKINYAKQGIGSVFIKDTTSVSRLFNSNLTYNKGGIVLHMLRWYIGDSLFFKSLKTYTAQFAFQTANTLNFKAVCEQVSGKDLSAFFQEWIMGTGYPNYQINWNYASSSAHFNVFQRNFQGSGNLFSIDLPLRLYFADGDSTDIRLQGNALAANYTKLNIADSIIRVEFNSKRQIMANGIVSKDTMLTSINEFIEKPLLNLYPNPCNEKLTIRTSLQMPVELNLFDMHGKLLSSTTQTKEEEILLLPESVGVYLLLIKNDKHQSIHKISRN